MAVLGVWNFTSGAWPHDSDCPDLNEMMRIPEMSIVLTEAAADQVRRQLQRRGAGFGLRVSLKRTGCSGWAYVVDYADAVEVNDEVFEQHGVNVVVDRDLLPRLEGMSLDYAREGLHAAFKFHNPNVKESCGCGESVSF
jgi:iron-sulfur cluster assembly protein